MANLLGQDIGLNYKGLINIGSTINQNISASLQSLTDGDGNLLPLEISTTQMSVGGATGTGRLIVRGDGTNPIFKAINNSGTEVFSIANSGNGYIGGTLVIGAGGLTLSGGNPAGRTFVVNRTLASAGGYIQQLTTSNMNFTGGMLDMNAVFGTTAGTETWNGVNIGYAINNTGTTSGSIVTGIKLNATETSLVGTTHNLMDLQIGGVSRFKVDRTGSTALSSITSNSWLVQFTDSATGFLLFRGANRFKVSAAGTMAVMGNAAIGWDTTVTSARLHVRGDGTNPIVRFENNAGTEVVGLSNSGTFSVLGNLSAGSGLSIGGGSYFFIGADGGAGTAKLVIRQNSNYLGSYGSNALHALYRFDSSANLTNTSGTDLVFLGVRNTFNPTSGTASYSNLSIEPTINQTGGANGITRGLHIKPTLTSAADFRAIETVNGNIIFGNLPTSSAGLPSGALWNNGGVVNIVP